MLPLIAEPTTAVCEIAMGDRVEHHVGAGPGAGDVWFDSVETSKDFFCASFSRRDQ
jgi:hypothetical protein